MKKVYYQPIVDTMVLTERLMDSVAQSRIVSNPTPIWPAGAPQKQQPSF